MPRRWVRRQPLMIAPLFRTSGMQNGITAPLSRMFSIDLSFDRVIHPDVKTALLAAVKALEAEKIPHFIVGDMGLVAYGLSRTTTAVDFIMRKQDWDHLKLKLHRHPFVLEPSGSLKHIPTGVTVDVQFSGDVIMIAL